MVGRNLACAATLVLAASCPVAAQSPQDRIFPGGKTCYARDYSAAHLAGHPQQRVSSIALTPDDAVSPDPRLELWVTITLRDQPGEQYLALAVCENSGDTVYCGLEGDAGGFTVEPAKGGAVLVRVTREGMSFEGENGFVTLESNRGDDRSFLLQPVRDCR